MGVTGFQPHSPGERTLASAINSQGLPQGTISDSGHTHTVTTTAIIEGRHVRYNGPITAALTGIVNTIDMANGAQSIAAQPDFPRKLQVRVVDANSSVSAGSVVLVGVGARGQAVTQTISLTGGSATTTTTDAYATLTSATISGLTGAASGDTIGIGPATALGLPGPKVLTPSTYAVFKSNVDNANETVGTVDATAGTIAPTTAPNGTHTYDFWYNFTYTPVNPSTGSSTTGITTAVGSTTYFHRAVSEITVTAAAGDGTLAKALLLVNNLFAVYMGSATNRTAGAFPGHVYDTLVHKAADSTNLTTSTYPATDLTSACTLANELYTDYNAHLTQSGVHDNNDGTNTASSSSATDQSSLDTRLNDLRTKMIAHIASGVPRNVLRVYT